MQGGAGAGALNLRAILALPAIRATDPESFHRTVELYDVNGFDFAAAYLIASAERSGIGVVASLTAPCPERDWC